MFKGSDLFQDLFLAWKQCGLAQRWKMQQENMGKWVLSGVVKRHAKSYMSGEGVGVCREI